MVLLQSSQIRYTIYSIKHKVINFYIQEDFEDNDEVDVPLEEPDNHSNGDPGEDRRLDGLAYPKNSKYTSFSMSPDFGLLDLLRQALIAMSLMPENSSAGLVILTDGVISVPDGRYLDIILSQLRYNTVSCSFIQLSSPFHPHLCHGVLPYADLMKFIASATFGAFLSEAPEIVSSQEVYNAIQFSVAYLIVMNLSK